MQGRGREKLRHVVTWRHRWNGFFGYFGLFLALVAITLGYWGYQECFPEEAWQDHLYRALQHFALSVPDLSATPCAGEDIRVHLEVSRFLSAALLASAVISLLFRRVWYKFRLRTQAWLGADRRHILIGYGAINQEVARERVNKGVPLTIVARAFDDAARAFASKHPIVLVERDIRDEASMAGLHLHRAARVIVALGDDSLTIETAQLVSALIQDRDRKAKLEDKVFAHFTDSEVLRQLRLTSGCGFKVDRSFSGFAIRDETARYLFSRTWLAERALRTKLPDGAGMPRLHVVIVGGGDLGMAMTREAILHGCSAKLCRPKVTVIDRDPDGGKARFKARMPHLFDDTIPEEDRPDITFDSCHAEAFTHDTIKNDVPIMAWIICCTEDATNLALAMRLEGEMRSGQRPPAPIYPRQWQGNVRDGGLQRIGQEDPWHLVSPFGGMQDVVPTLSFLDDKWLRLAKSIHAAYEMTVKENFKDTELKSILGQYGPPPWPKDEGPHLDDPKKREEIIRDFNDHSQKFSGKWEDLDDETRLANLSSAYQATVRLWELGFDWKGRYSGALPTVSVDDIRAVFPTAHEKAEISQKELEALSARIKPGTHLGEVCAAEHRRWMIERSTSGWSAANPGDRSNALKMHANFRSYAELFEDAKQKVDRMTDKPDDEDAQKIVGENLRLLDAATLRGVMTALTKTRGYPALRRLGVREACSILDGPEFSRDAVTLDITVPMIKSEDDQARLTEAVKKLVGSMGDDVRSDEAARAFSVRLVPETAEVWAEPFIKDALDTLRVEAAERDIHLLIEHADGTEMRAEKLRPAYPKKPLVKTDV